MPSWRAGVMTPSLIGVPVAAKLRYWKPSGRCRRTAPSARSGTGPIGPYPPLLAALPVEPAARAPRANSPCSGPDSVASPAADRPARRRKPRRSVALISDPPGLLEKRSGEHKCARAPDLEGPAKRLAKPLVQVPLTPTDAPIRATMT